MLHEDGDFSTLPEGLEECLRSQLMIRMWEILGAFG